MWLFEKHGFVSVVSYDPTKDKKHDSPFRDIVGYDPAKKDPKCAETHLLVRARIKEDLDMLKRVEPKLVIDTDTAADYSFRCVVRRGRMKKFLAQAVDGITYDSHFKEVADANSPEAAGRHAAMMSCWTAMATLQPHSPYGTAYSWAGDYGYGTGKYGSTWGGKPNTGAKASASTKSGGQGKAPGANGKSAGIVVGSTAQYGTEGTSADQRGYETVEDWVNAYYDSEETLDWRGGSGPRHGFSVGDRVEGYFGYGKITKVEERAEFDVLTVRQEASHVTGTFLSNYVVPADVPAVLDSNIEDEADDTDLDEFGFLADRTIDGLYTWLMDHGRDPALFPPDDLQKLDDDAFELITRVGEFLSQGDDTISIENVNRIYDEIQWERSNDDEKAKLVMSDNVPAKYVDEALKLPAFSAKTN